MFLSREIDIKLCKNYTKIYIYEILRKGCSIKQIIFNKYATNLKTIISHRNLRISGFCGISLFSDWLRNFGIWSVLYYNLSKLHIYYIYYIFFVQRLRFSGFSPFHFSFTVPLTYFPLKNKNIKIQNKH